MLLSPRYPGLELPVYRAEDVPITDVRAISVAQPDETFTEHTALRAVQMELDHATPVPDNLKDFLDITDKEMDKAAGLCRAEVVGHQWGLVHDPDGIHYDDQEQLALCCNTSGFIPKDHFLVAEVDIIKNLVEMRSRNAPAILARHAMAAMAVGIGVKAYRLVPHTKGYRLRDFLPRQFGVGTRSAEGDVEPRMWYLDIEPRLTTN